MVEELFCLGLHNIVQAANLLDWMRQKECLLLNRDKKLRVVVGARRWKKVKTTRIRINSFLSDDDIVKAFEFETERKLDGVVSLRSSQARSACSRVIFER